MNSVIENGSPLAARTQNPNIYFLPEDTIYFRELANEYSSIKIWICWPKAYVHLMIPTGSIKPDQKL